LKADNRSIAGGFLLDARCVLPIALSCRRAPSAGLEELGLSGDHFGDGGIVAALQQIFGKSDSVRLGSLRVQPRLACGKLVQRLG
jgi:hypothetical protein